MLLRISRVIAVVALGGAAYVTVAAPAGAQPGYGTWTKITTPGGTTTLKFDSVHPGRNHFPVAGKTSPDVTSVDIVCMEYPFPVATPAVNVPVTDGAFSTTATFSAIPSPCRLRAVPTGVDPTVAYLASYAGPILYANGIRYATVGSTPIGFSAFGEQGDGIAELQDAGQCGAYYSGTFDLHTLVRTGGATVPCAFALPAWDVPSDASAITVNGHNAYLPFGVSTFLNAPPQSLGLPQPALAVQFARFGNGDVRVTESAPLQRCSGDDTYPPTGASCPGLLDTGVTFTRVGDIFRGAHQIRFRDTYASTDGHKHPMTVQYEGQNIPLGRTTGAPGYTYPGGPARFHRSSLGQTVTGLGTRAGTMYIRSDLYSVEGDALTDTDGLTWSRAPQAVHFSATIPGFFALPYALTVPANGAAHIGFAFSAHVLTSDTKQLAAVAVAEMVNRPTIAAPANGAVIHGRTTTVRGRVTAGANGRPTSVTVNGHPAQLTGVDATTAKYSVTFRESLGKHTLDVTAKDVAGNRKSASISVRNV